ncbi:unnamed protein product [Closterium sp. Naga37s-1]|nr:unnamed protein product [Closterium sp. Naga37s-1]
MRSRSHATYLGAIGISAIHCSHTLFPPTCRPPSPYLPPSFPPLAALLSPTYRPPSPHVPPSFPTFTALLPPIYPPHSLLLPSFSPRITALTPLFSSFPQLTPHISPTYLPPPTPWPSPVVLPTYLPSSNLNLPYAGKQECGRQEGRVVVTRGVRAAGEACGRRKRSVGGTRGVWAAREACGVWAAGGACGRHKRRVGGRGGVCAARESGVWAARERSVWAAREACGRHKRRVGGTRGVWVAQEACGRHKRLVGGTRGVWAAQQACGRHKRRVGGTRGVWAAQEACGRHKRRVGGMRRRPGVAGLQTAAAVRGQYRSLGEDVAKQRQESLRQQLETFRGFLMEFAQKHKSDFRSNPAFMAQFHAMCAQCGVDPLASFPSPHAPLAPHPPLLQSDIRSNPAFRAQFHAMCAQCGVDPLASNKGFWNELLGFGDFYYELGVQLIETCMATRADNGGMINLEELRRLVAGKRRMPLDALSHDDCMRALATIKSLGGGFAVEKVGATHVVRSLRSQETSLAFPTNCCHRQSLGGGFAVEKVGATHVSLGGGFAVEKVGATHVVRSLPRELSTDQNDILRLAQARGCVSIADILSATAWQHGRINDALDALLKEGIAMVDDGDPDGQRRYWFPCFDIAAPASL